MFALPHTKTDLLVAPPAAQAATAEPDAASAGDAERVKLAVRDVLPLLLHAAQHSCAWLEDFDEDRLELSQDFYEVLLAYHRFRHTPLQPVV